jgi:flagellar motor switch protein FliN/FliY
MKNGEKKPVSATIVDRIDLPALKLDGEEKSGGALGDRFDLIEDLKVKLMVTMGGSEITVAKLFSLAPGDVVALDRDVDAPVDIRLHGKLIARGALVAVGEKFGVRITQIENLKA